MAKRSSNPSDEARSRLAAIVESSDDAIIGETLDTIITSWNAAATRLFGYHPLEIIGKSVLQLIPKELHAGYAAIMGKLKSGGKIGHFEAERIKKNGERIDVSLTISPIKDSVGRVIGASNIVRDITEIKLAHLELRQLTARLFRVQEEERQRIARELHGDIGQRLSLLIMELDLLNQKGPAEKTAERAAFVKVLRQAEEIATGVHQLSHRLHTSKLQHLGLKAALKELCQQQSPRMPVDLVVENVPEAMPMEIALCFYRIAQEALTNAARHRGASGVMISVTRRNGLFRMQIKDSGNGFDPSLPSDGVGLASMRERLRLIGGKFRASSTIGDGIQLVAEVKVQRWSASA